ncbi:hypothetical protein JCM8115_002159 [Rhodotorula mucilaginosa]
MALFLDRRSGQTVPSKLREVFPDLDTEVPAGCPIYVLDESDDDSTASVSSSDESFYDAWEDLPPLPKPVRLPEEILEAIMRNLEALDGEEACLKACSLVCKEWSLPARRVLLGGGLTVSSADAAKRLREILDSHVELRPAVRSINLNGAMRDGLIAPYFRRVAALFRHTPNLRMLQLVHVGLSEKNRHRLYPAMRHLPLTHIILYSSSWSVSHVGQTPGDHAADIREISRLLCEWTQLNSLTLSGYASYPRLLLPNTVPAHAFPTYRLESLHLLSCNLADSTVLWLLGNSTKTLKQLNLCGCSGLTSDVLSDVFEVLGSTLETLVLTLDVDDLTAAPGPQSIRSEVVEALVQLRVVSISTDSVFPEDIVHTLVALPLVESISLCYPSFTYAIIRGALASLTPASKLEKLYLDAWETPDMWTETERWDLAQLCEKRGVELVLNGLVRADIEEEWYGEDFSEDWRILERLV